MLTELLAQFAMITVLNHTLPTQQGTENYFIELAQKNGFKATQHDVITEDGYILKMFHVPGNRNKPVLISHGVLDSAETFMLRGRTSLVAFLAGNGYDLWLLNNRGTPNSRRHVHLDPDKDRVFWDFSFHEMSVYDLPACIDYVLTQNGEKTLSLIGHSLGNIQYYILGAMRPEYNGKVNIAIALGPVGILHYENLEIPVSTIVDASQAVNAWLESRNQDEVLNKSSPVQRFIQFVCARKWVGYELCVRGVLSTISGEDIAEFEPKLLPELLKHYPCSTSRKTLVHLAQISSTKHFAQFDYGVKKNLQMYQSPSPPAYDLRKATMKLALLIGANDKIANVKNSEILRDMLPNVVSYEVMEHKRFNHMDHIWGRHMNKYLFPHILRLLDKYGASGEV